MKGGVDTATDVCGEGGITVVVIEISPILSPQILDMFASSTLSIHITDERLLMDVDEVKLVFVLVLLRFSFWPSRLCTSAAQTKPESAWSICT